MQHCGFDPPLGRTFPVEGIFPLELTWVLTPFPKNSFGWEYKPRSSLCTHAFHRRDSKDPDVHVLDGWMPATKTHPACTAHEDGMWVPQWLDLKKKKKKNGHIRKKLTQNGEPQRSSWGTPKKKKKKICEIASTTGTPTSTQLSELRRMSDQAVLRFSQEILVH